VHVIALGRGVRDAVDRRQSDCAAGDGAGRDHPDDCRGQGRREGHQEPGRHAHAPAPSVAADALRESRSRQTAERLAAGEAYSTAGHVLVDEIGHPFKTNQLRRRLDKLMAQTGVRKVRPYDARHACLTYLAANGVPDVVVSAWAGHADLSFTKRVYVHPDESRLAPAAERLNALLTHASSA
jgi:integrase